MSRATRSLVIALLCGLRSALGAGGEGASMRKGETFVRQASETLTALEMNHRDTVKFTLGSGQVRTLVLEDTSARILERVPHGGVVYQFSCRVRIDGHRMTLVRYVGTQESFYEPHVVNGLRIWLDAVSDIFRLIPMRDMETQRVPHKHARFAFQDAALPICPRAMKPWYRNDGRFIDIGDCYNGDDCWLGAYQGQACHGGLDVNHRRGDPLWAPIDFDDHWLFNSLAAGHNNNRWRGVRRWPNGDVWALQTHHIVKLLVPEHAPIKAGTHYAAAAGVHVGHHDHTHFVFKVAPSAGGPEVHLDPWILFWQIFESQKGRAGAIRAAMKPLSPCRAGEAVSFSAQGSRRGRGGGKLSCTWTFGDGGWSYRARAVHTFARPGLYPVRLVVDDGVNRAACTQHVTVDGEPIESPALALAAPDEVTFHCRSPQVMDVYGWPVRRVPRTLEFVARPTRPVPGPRTVELRNVGGGHLPKAKTPTIRYLKGNGWLTCGPKWVADRQALAVASNAAGLKPGSYSALVTVECPGAANSPQGFRVVLRVPKDPPASGATVDDRDAGFYCTPYFWVGHRFCRNRRIGWHRMRPGHRGFYLTNGGRPAAGEFARFTPDLAAGRHRVSLSEETPFGSKTEFTVRVRHRSGETRVRMQPQRSRVIGEFDFHEGNDGFVEILAEDSTGVVAADAIAFERVPPRQ